MLKKLTIQNYALIESLDIDLPDGLIIITGETGAGKSILLGALGLLLGGKCDMSVLKDTSKNCVVEGLFDIGGCNLELSEIFGEDMQGEEEELCSFGSELVLRRVIAPSGRSRAFINDEPVQVSLLQKISGRLVDIHAQHQHLLLGDSAYQLQILDYFAGSKEILADYREVHSALLRSKALLKQMEQDVESNAREEEYKRFQLAKLEEAKLVSGELEELELEHGQLANAEEIKEALATSLALFQPMGSSIVQNLKEAAHLLGKCYTFVPELQEVVARLESCRIECKDIEEELARLEESMVVSPQRLETVEERIGLLEDLMKRYGCATVEELISYRDALGYELESAEKSATDMAEQIALVGKLEAKREELARKLSALRRAKSKELGSVLEASIRELGMPHAKFAVELDEAVAYSDSGRDAIKFMFAANGGAALTDIAKVASGGELSRIMLCLKELMANYTGMPTMIFDEIDTGVSGSIADKMGEMIGRMGNNMQVIAITHLPQIAVKGETHLLVYKEFDSGNRARTYIRQLVREERIMEVARMLSGSELSEAAIENAKF
ncbi:MAG: DNA repair protein RecN, partial [Bacteroidales bacterium]|nr:DNA repair protein RecN [Bacteroidales bacterium]